MTASHNPAEYQGLKFSPSNGAAAPPQVTRRVEANIARRQAAGWSFQGTLVGTFSCKTIDPRPAYFKQVRKLVDFETIKQGKLKIAVQFMYGTGRGYLDTLLSDAGARLIVFNDRPDPMFGGHHPEPNAEGMADVRIVEALYRSLAEGQPVTIEPVRKVTRPIPGQAIERPAIDEPELVYTESPHY
jgi:phosphomannomutase